MNTHSMVFHLRITSFRIFYDKRFSTRIEGRIRTTGVVIFKTIINLIFSVQQVNLNRLCIYRGPEFCASMDNNSQFDNLAYLYERDSENVVQILLGLNLSI